MASDLPKVLQPLAGRPLLAHVVATARALKPAAIHVVYGHGGERVREAFAGEPTSAGRCRPSRRAPGTPLMQAMPGVPDEPRACSCSTATCRSSAPRRSRASSRARARTRSRCCRRGLPDPAGYGRVIRDGARPRRAHRRRERREPRGARDRRDQHRRPRRARGEAARLARRAQGRQRAGRVLSDRLHRRRGARRLCGRRRGRGHAIGGPGRERQAPARRGRSARTAAAAPRN